MFDRPETAADRAQATDTLLQRAGLTTRVVRWRAHALLSPWWAAGWCVAGLLHALDHHPDQPESARGDATRAARDPLRVLGHRLTPWRGRRDELPYTLHSVDGPARQRRTAARAELDPPTRPAGHRVTSTPAVRAAARAQLLHTLGNRP